MIEHVVAQRTPAWYALRCGRVSASQAEHVLAKLKGSGEAAGRRDLRMLLARERLSGLPDDGPTFISSDMQRGIDLEPEALVALELSGALPGAIRAVGYLTHDTLPVGYSPDGVVGPGADTLVEVKCPRMSTHLDYLDAPTTIPARHLPQLTHALWLTGASVIHFASYCPAFARYPLFTLAVPRDTVDLDAYDTALRTFLDEVDTLVMHLNAKYPLKETVYAVSKR
jgi:hypothetical protein